MAEHFVKSTLLQEIHESYAQLEQIVELLTPEQATLFGVNGPWSVKDNLSHLAAWQDYGIKLLQSVHDHVPFDHPFRDMEIDDINEMVYQATKDRPYDEVRQQFQTNFQRFVEGVESVSEEQINAIPSGGTRPLANSIIDNSSEHFQEHHELIKNWLAQQASK